MELQSTSATGTLLLLVGFLSLGMSGTAFATPQSLVAEAHDSRVDLIWERQSDRDDQKYQVYRAESADGEFERITDVEKPHDFHVYSDFLGHNGRAYFYRVTRVREDGSESPPSAVVSATPAAMSDEELLTSLQQASFRYFWDYGHPVSGVARAGFKINRDTCTSGGTGFGIMTIMVGADRGFVSREAAAARILKQVRFLQDKVERYHGAWPHRFNGRTGETIPFFDPADNGGDLVETAYVIQGMLAARQYFDRDDPVENELRERITTLWEEVEWDWYLREEGGTTLFWHWSPDHGWKKNHRIRGFNECMITYILALASPTHPIPDAAYEEGWIHDETRYGNGSEYYGIRKFVGRPMGGPLFFTHYSYMGLDPRAVTDRFCNYFENNRNKALINRAWCIDNPGNFEGYGDLIWGLTSSQNPKGYRAHAPMPDRDDGTVAPTGALSSMPYTPEESMATLRHFYHKLGDRIWLTGGVGFCDAFNLGAGWYSPDLLAIDAGPIAPMIENHRTGLCWREFMKNREITDTLQRLGIATKQSGESPANR